MFHLFVVGKAAKRIFEPSRGGIGTRLKTASDTLIAIIYTQASRKA